MNLIFGEKSFTLNINGQKLGITSIKYNPDEVKEKGKVSQFIFTTFYDTEFKWLKKGITAELYCNGLLEGLEDDIDGLLKIKDRRITAEIDGLYCVTYYCDLTAS